MKAPQERRSTKIGLAGTLAGLLAISCSAPLGESQTIAVERSTTRHMIRDTFRDVPNTHPDHDAIRYVANHCLMEGDSNALFRPELAISRGEILHILLEGTGDTIVPITTPPFSDVDPHHPLAPYVARALERHIVQGYDDRPIGERLFHIDRTASRIETLKMLFLSFNITIDTLPRGASYEDIPAGSWYEGLALYVQQHHLLAPVFGNVLGRDHPINRAQLAQLIYNLLRERPDLIGTLRGCNQ